MSGRLSSVSALAKPLPGPADPPVSASKPVEVPPGMDTDPLRRALVDTPQLDNTKLTFNGNVRCGAASTVAAALLRGPSGVNALLAGLERPGRNAELTALARRELATTGTLERLTIQRLQDALYELANTDNTPGLTATEQAGGISIAGLPTRSFDVGSLYRNSGDSKRSQEQEGMRMRTALEGQLQPGEAAPVFLTNRGTDMGHIVLYARDNDGRFFLYDSGGYPSVMYRDDPQHASAIADVTSRLQSVMGDRIIDIRRQ